MAQIGHGYGSEWQLLRFLGHHRELLESEITKQLKLSNGSHFKWLDFGFGDRTKSISGDEEIKGLNFLKNITSMPISFDEYPSGWGKKYPSWDAIVIINDIVYLVEAKAHIDEISGNKNNGGESQEQIFSFMSEQLKAFGCTTIIKKEKWLGKYFQMANRLAVAAYLNNKGIPTKVLYIYFENGYYKRGLNGENLSLKTLTESSLKMKLKKRRMS